MTTESTAAANPSSTAIQLSREALAALKAAILTDDFFADLLKNQKSVMGRVTLVNGHSRFTRIVIIAAVVELSPTSVILICDYPLKPGARILIDLGKQRAIHCEVRACDSLQTGLHRLITTYLTEININAPSRHVDAGVKNETPDHLHKDLSARERREIRELEMRLHLG